MANTAFLCRAIAAAQKLDIGNPFCVALHEYINRTAGFMRDERGLVWVKHPDGPQVAVWLMGDQCVM